MKNKIILIASCILLNLSSATFALAIEVAPHISDREIVEKLVTLKVGQDALGQRMDDMNQRMDDMNQRMEAGQAALRSEMKSGQAALRSEMKSGQAALSKRMDDMNQRMESGLTALRSEMKSGLETLGQRISDQQTTMLALFSTMVALILALFAYIAWDRRTMIKPVVERVEHLENEVLRELDMGHDKGSAITRLIKAMRELAQQDEKVASVLRNFSLL